MIVDTHLETALWLLATALVTIKVVQFAIIWRKYQKEYQEEE